MGKLLNIFKSNKTIQNFIIYGIGQGINLISPLLITPYLIYVCGIEKLGIIAIGQSLAYILNVIIDYSSNIVGVKEIAINRFDNKILEKSFTTIYISKLILFSFVCLLLFCLVFFIPFLYKESVLIFYSVTIILAQLINPTWFFQGIENFKWITIINILSKVIYVVAVLFLITQKQDYIYANLWLGLGAILANLIGFLWIIKKYNFSFKKICFKTVKLILTRDFSFCLSQLFFAIRNYSSVLIVGFFAGDYIAGQFKVIEQIITLLRTYVQMFFRFSYSYICFAIDQNLQKGIQLWKKFNGLNLVVLCIALLCIYFSSEEILYFFRVDETLIKLLESYLHIALFVPFLIGLTSSLEQLIFSLNANKPYIRLTIASTSFNIMSLSLTMMYFTLHEVFYILIFTEACLVISYLILLRPYFLNSTSIIIKDK